MTSARDTYGGQLKKERAAVESRSTACSRIRRFSDNEGACLMALATSRPVRLMSSGLKSSASPVVGSAALRCGGYSNIALRA